MFNIGAELGMKESHRTLLLISNEYLQILSPPLYSPDLFNFSCGWNYSGWILQESYNHLKNHFLINTTYDWIFPTLYNIWVRYKAERFILKYWSLCTRGSGTLSFVGQNFVGHPLFGGSFCPYLSGKSSDNKATNLK